MEIIILSKSRGTTARFRIGLPLVLVTAITLATGSADSFALRNHGMKAMLPGKFPQRAYSTLYALKDVRYALELARDAGVELSGASNARTLLKRAAEAGFGEEYFPVLAKVIAKANPRKGH